MRYLLATLLMLPSIAAAAPGRPAEEMQAMPDYYEIFNDGGDRIYGRKSSHSSSAENARSKSDTVEDIQGASDYYDEYVEDHGKPELDLR